MGDNKISEAAALAASLRQIADAQYTRRQRFNGRLPADVQEVLRMAAGHLQGEAVPVAHSEFALRALVAAGHVGQDKVDGALSIAASTLLQPAELNEVSGNSGELGVPAGWKLVPIEPNWDMRNEGREFLIDGIEKEPERLAYFLWKTMVAAAPEVL